MKTIKDYEHYYKTWSLTNCTILGDGSMSKLENEYPTLKSDEARRKRKLEKSGEIVELIIELIEILIRIIAR